MDTSPLKTPFIEVFRLAELDYEILVNVARDVADVPKMAVKDMIEGSPVSRHDAMGVLKILSQHTGKIWNLDTVDVPLLPSPFAEIFARHDIDKKELAKMAGVTADIIDLMIQGQRVLQALADKVLLALSAMTRQDYNLKNVAVNILLIISNQSEVARLMQSIEDEYAACQQALTGPTLGTAQHQFITKREENIAGYAGKLYTLVGTHTTHQLLQQFGD